MTNTYQTHVVDAETWTAKDIGDEFMGGTLVEGSADNSDGGEVLLLITRHPVIDDTLRLPSDMTDATKKFTEWAIRASWEGGTLDGGDIQDKAVELGLLVEVTYDPDEHGPNDCDAEKGDPWYVLSDELK